MKRCIRYYLIRLKRRRKLPLVIAFIVISAILAAHIFLAIQLATDSPGDGLVYSQIAKNVLEQGVYSLDTLPPYNPTLVRVPGYPLFLTTIYALFGHGNNTAVRVVQAIIHTATCGLIALLAWNWVKDKKRRKIAAWMAFLMAALCPFTLIYAATILTETITTFLMTAMALTATNAFKSNSKKSLIIWWILTGFLAGTAVLLRPDSGLFAFGIGLTLVVTSLFKRGETESKFLSRFWKIIWQGIVFSLAFMLPLVPWTIRNEQVFGLFQPLHPKYAVMPDEFVPEGYFQWVQTWIDDPKYIEPMIVNIGEKPIKIEKIPDSAFDNDDEKAQVIALLNQYNPSPKPKNNQNSMDNDKSDDNSDSDNKDDADDDNSSDKSNNDDKNNNDENDDGNEDQPPDENQQKPQMTPEINAGFAQIAQQRIERKPFRYYVSLPIKRVIAMWFDTHSAYYPFEGDLFPLKDLDPEADQEIWLPLLAALVLVYTFLAIIGGFFLWMGKDSESHFGLVLTIFMVLLRFILVSTLANPEPRYVVELFAFTAILGGIALARLKFRRENGKFSLEFFYGRD